MRERKKHTHTIVISIYKASACIIHETIFSKLKMFHHQKISHKQIHIRIKKATHSHHSIKNVTEKGYK